MQNKNPPEKEDFRFFCRLLKFRSFYRASTLACAAFNALVGIDNILAVLFGNGAYRASVSARTAADALFGIDYIRHNYSPFLGSDEIFYFGMPCCRGASLLLHFTIKIGNVKLFMREIKKVINKKLFFCKKYAYKSGSGGKFQNEYEFRKI